MLHPIFSLLVRRPDLAVDHVAAYASLVQQEAATASALWLKRLLAWILFGLSASVFLTLAGVAVMLGVMHNQFHWALVLVPAAVLVATLIALQSARRPMPDQAFAEVRAQLGADLQALQAAGGSPHER